MPTVSVPRQEGIRVDDLEEQGIETEQVFRAEKPKARSSRARTRRQPDPKPQTEGLKPEPERHGIPTDKVEEAFAEILSLPALFYKAPTPMHCDWCATHFARQGPATAKELVENRQHYPALYAGMEKIAAAWMAFSLMPMILNYVAPPVIHHGPEILEPLGPLFHVPPKSPKPDTMETIFRHEHTTASEGTIPGTSIPSDGKAA